MSHGADRNPDDVNTTAIITIGLAGAAAIFASMIALEAFYYHETAPLEIERATLGGDVEVRTARAAQISAIKEPGAGKVSIERAMQLVLDDAKAGKDSLVPAVGPHDKPTIPPIYGMPAPGAKWPPDPAPTEGATPADGTAPAGAPDDGTAAPAQGAATPTPAPSAPAPAVTPAPAAPAVAPAPAAPTPAAPAAPAPAAPGGNAP